MPEILEIIVDVDFLSLIPMLMDRIIKKGKESERQSTIIQEYLKNPRTPHPSEILFKLADTLKCLDRLHDDFETLEACMGKVRNFPPDIIKTISEKKAELAEKRLIFDTTIADNFA